MTEGDIKEEKKGAFKWPVASFKDPLALFVLLSCLPVFLYACRDLLEKNGDLPCFAALRLSCAQMMMEGQKPYQDFFEWSQPIVFEFCKIPYLLQTVFGGMVPLRIEVISKVVILASMLVSMLASLYMLAKAKRTTENPDIDLVAPPLLASYLFFFFYERLQLGELQYFYFQAAVPFILLGWLTNSGLVINKYLRLAIGLAAGFCACLDLPLPLGMSLVIIWTIFNGFKNNGLKTLWRLENLGFLLALLLVGGHYLLLPSDVRHAYEHWVLPIKTMSYATFDDSISGGQSAPDNSIVYYLGGFAIMMAMAASSRLKVLAPLGLVCLCGFYCGLLERQGFARDLILAAGLSITLFIMSGYYYANVLMQKIESLWKERLKNIAYPVFLQSGKLTLVALALFLIGSSLFLAKRADNAYGAGINPHPKEIVPGAIDINIAVEKDSQWKKPVLILADTPDCAYPLLFDLERPPGGYLLNGRPARLLNHLNEIDGLVGDWREFYEHILANTKNDFENKRAQLVFVHGAHMQVFLEKGGILATLTDNYEKLQDAYYASDNVEPREFLGFYYAIAQYKRKGDAP